MAQPAYPTVGPPDETKPTGHRPTDYQLDAIARMLVSGASVSMIASATGLTTTRVKTAINTHAKDRIEQVQGQVIRATATHYFELLGMLDEVRTNIRGGLGSADERIRLETSKWLHDTLIPKPTTRTDTENRLSVSPELGDAITSIASSVATLIDAKLNTRELPIRMGLDALPRPVVDAEHS